jgi:hypothetical protein
MFVATTFKQGSSPPCFLLLSSSRKNQSSTWRWRFVGIAFSSNHGLSSNIHFQMLLELGSLLLWRWLNTKSNSGIWNSNEFSCCKLWALASVWQLTKLVCTSSKVGSQIPNQGWKIVLVNECTISFYLLFFWIFVMNALFISTTHHCTKLSRMCLCFCCALVCLVFYLKCFAFVVPSIVFLFIKSWNERTWNQQQGW